METNIIKKFNQIMIDIENGIYPDAPRLPIDEPFINDNGEIFNLAHGKFATLTLINSLPHTIRANHYHKTDWHISYVISGFIKYYWRGLNQENLNYEIFKSGESFFSPPMLPHAMYFPEKTTFITVSRNTRSHENHEQDLVRLKIISLENV
jgi:dTDP-4-dehydrorhamnose 3,5-epimerase-like enzyme